LLLSTFLVNNTNDSGAGSLRQAVLDCNANQGTNIIAFDIDGGGVQTIRPTRPLPTITNPVVIDGTTQPGYAGVPLIELNGSAAGPSAIGVTIQGGNSTVKGLIINGFAQAGIELTIGWTNTITGNYLGTDSTGTTGVGNGDGLLLSYTSYNVIGGTNRAERNIISGNQRSGIHVTSDVLTQNNIIEGNYIGTDVGGVHGLGNQTGVELREANNTVGGTFAGAGNLISGNRVGVGIYNYGTIVQGNTIGTDVTGTAAVPNDQGILVSGGGAMIGGTVTGARNLISGNSSAGIEITNGRTAGVVEGNYIGTDVTGTKPVANSYGVYLSFGTSNNVIGGTTAGAGNVISGNVTGMAVLASNANQIQGNYIGTNATGTAVLANFDGIQLLSGDRNMVGGTAPGAGNVISGNTNVGLLVPGGGNQVQGNLIGLDAQGTAALPNTERVFISGPGNQIGGTANRADNVISGNLSSGVNLFGSFATGNQVEGNRIGTDVTGTAPVPNGEGVTVSGSNNTIGGTAAGSRNLISGNVGIGVFLAGNGNVVQGDYIGTDADGSSPLGMQGTGVNVSGSNNVVGGTVAAARNVISGNANHGMFLVVPAQNTLVQGNFIGTDVTGTRAVGNGNGIFLDDYNNVIGGMAPGTGNLISGNRLTGIVFFSDSSAQNVVQGNLVGTDITGTRALGNQVGLEFLEALANLIGGTSPQARNIISANHGDGIQITLTNGLNIQGNFIGTDISGTQALGNGGNGISFSGAQNYLDVIGGTTAGAGNLISANGQDGVFLGGGNSPTVQGNFIGTDVTGTKALGNINGVTAAIGVLPLIGGTAVGAGNIISGNSGIGILVAYSRDGYTIDTTIQGNRIGTDVTGTRSLANREGVAVQGGTGATVGGTVAGAGNLISGNQFDGVELDVGNNVVTGNWIGTDVSGTLAVANDRNGVLVTGIASTNNLIGGPAASARNVISGNSSNGVSFAADAHGNVLEGNYIGTDVTGTMPLGNVNGVLISNAVLNIIGGTAAGAGNLITGNFQAGVLIEGKTANSNLVQGNWIGTDSSGGAPLGNGRDGVALTEEASGNTIGGTAAGAANLIGGNVGNGISTASGSEQNFIQGNLIGTDATYRAALGNGRNGILLEDASNNTIGGTAQGAANVIAYNTGNGILVNGGASDAIRRNAIFGHDNGLGIKLTDGGNHNQEFPELTSAVSDGSTITLTGTLTSTPDTTFTVEVFVNTACNPSGYGEGKRFVASLTVPTDANGKASFMLTVAIEVDPGQFIAATATGPTRNTSQFSNCVEVSATASPTVSVIVLPAVVGVAELGPDANTSFLSLLPTATEITDRFTQREQPPALTALREAPVTPSTQYEGAFRSLRAAAEQTLDIVFEEWCQAMCDNIS
jgi:hypothetical protein